MDHSYADYIIDQLHEFGPCRARRMFGGHGIYSEKLMFGLIHEDVFYLKVDAENRPTFEAEGSEPFTYQPKNGPKPVQMSYWRVPESVLDDPEELAVWGRGALAAAKRAKS